MPLGTKAAALVVVDDGETASHHSERYIPPAAVRDLCGGISDMTLWRWLRNPELGFPKPIKVMSRRFWREADVLSWLASRSEADAD